MAEITGFLIDQMLPARLVATLSNDYPESTHVREAGLASATDKEVAAFADKNSLAILTKDSDFDRMTEFGDSPNKVVRIAVGNLPNESIVQIVQAQQIRLQEFLAGDDRLLVILRPE